MITASCKEIVEVELDDKVLGKKRQVKLKDKTGSVVEVFLFLGVASI